jgi:hypothetical protein
MNLIIQNGAEYSFYHLMPGKDNENWSCVFKCLPRGRLFVIIGTKTAAISIDPVKDHRFLPAFSEASRGS